MYSAIVFLPLLGAIIAGVIALATSPIRPEPAHGHAGPGDIRAGSVHRLKDRRLVADVGPRNHPQATDQAGAQIGHEARATSVDFSADAANCGCACSSSAIVLSTSPSLSSTGGFGILPSRQRVYSKRARRALRYRSKLSTALRWKPWEPFWMDLMTSDRDPITSPLSVLAKSD